ncbi:MAG: bifunctional diaminohydroxyphosphoribosylaminopyrimidine deaminase/5-amino-6-(5-phosphoribosylamino)uracil reductase RibD [archaeon]
MKSDVFYMQEALGQARKGHTSPNPRVGCVIVSKDRVIARGYHVKAGADHAEVMALKEAGILATGATLYVNLEPCCHQGRTPPCTDAIIAAGISRVVSAVKDPNPRVDGKGFEILRRVGITVDVGTLAIEAAALNESYMKHIVTGMPFVTAKAAVSLDGKIASYTGDSKWISSPESRKKVHRMRSESDAVLVGLNTVIKDNPRLTCRIRGGRDPLRVILDSRLSVPPDARVFDDDNVVVACLEDAPRRDNLRVIRLKADAKGRPDLALLMKTLGGMQVCSVLIEGGSEVLGSAFDSGTVDRIVWFIAPIIIGGRSAVTAVAGEGAASVSKALKFRETRVGRCGPDIVVDGLI